MKQKLIIGHKEYTITENKLLCRSLIFKDLFDKNNKSKELYYIRENEFIIITRRFWGAIEKTEVIKRDAALKFMDMHPDGIQEDVYKKYFGEPEKI